LHPGAVTDGESADGFGDCVVIASDDVLEHEGAAVKRSGPAIPAAESTAVTLSPVTCWREVLVVMASTLGASSDPDIGLDTHAAQCGDG
jgi:hypothetical protein